MHVSLLTLAGLAVVCATLAIVSGDAAAEPHAPIIIEGEDALCEPGSGVVNCGSADGSPEAPYVISGWRVTGEPLLTPRCGYQGTAGILLCDLTSHVVVRDVEVLAHAGVPLDMAALGAPSPAAAVFLGGNAWVRLEDVYAESSGLGLRVDVRRAEDSFVAVERSRFVARAASSPVLEVIQARGSHLTLHDVSLEAVGRNFAIQSVSVAGREQDLHLQDVTIEGPMLQAIQVQGGRLTVRDSNVTMEAVQRISDDLPLGGLETSAISALNGAHVVIEDTRIGFAGVGLSLNNASSLHVRGNTFIGTSPFDVALEITADKSNPAAACAFLADFNDIGDLVVTNGMDDCELEAPDNWWGGEGPRDDQINGAILVPNWAPVDLGGMARVSLAHPVPLRIGSTMWLQGEATGPVSRLRLSGDVEQETASGAGPFTWEVPMQDEPLRELSLRLQACAPDFCGPPIEWLALRGAASLPPTPLIRVQPLVAAPGQEVLVDASGSFSPADVPIVAYRYGDGPWTSAPTMTFTFERLGSYPLSVHVRDQDGLESQEPATVTVRVREVLAPSSVDARDAGAPLLLWTIAILGISVRRWR